MALVNRSFSVNVTPGMMPPIVHVSEYDIGRAYTVSILDEQGNTFTIPSGTTASIEGTLNGAVGFTQSATVSNNQVSFTLSESMTAYSGKAWCKIKLTQSSQPIQTCAFVLAVDRAGVEAETVIGAPGFEEQIREAAEDWLEDQGFQSPTVSITDIEGGHRVTFTDAEHPQGQSIDVMDGTSVTVDPTLTISGAAADAKVTGDKISDLKSAIDESADFYDEELGIEFRPLKGTARSTDTPYSENKIIDTPLNANKTYRITWSIPTAISIPVYVFLSDGNGNNLIAVNIPAGDTEYVRDYTPNNNYSNAFLYFTVGNVPTIAVTASVSMVNAPPTRLDELESTVSFLAQNALYKKESRTVTIVNPDVGHYINKNGGYSASSPFSISQSIEVKSGETIEVIATGYNNEVAIIAKIQSAYPYTVLARSTSSSEETYVYQATQDICVVVSYDNRKSCSITIKKDVDINQISTNKAHIENSKWRYAFDRICCIGDSLTSGAYYAGTWAGASIAQNYPTILSRMLNTPVKNSGRSGASAKTWYTHNMDGLTLTDYGTFVIWLGTNGGLTDTIDTDVDPYVDYNDFADTNTGYLCRTICQIKATVPDAHIMICTVFSTTGDLTITNDVINQIATKYSLQLVDNSDLDNTNYPQYHSNTVHFNKAGNIFIADRIKNEMISYVAPDGHNAEFGLTARTD